jgi:uncharacterized protein
VPQRLVNDYAKIFSPAQRESLERTLVAFDDTTSNQITVVTVTDLEGYDVSEYATRIGLDWQVGSEKFDNGVVILVKPKIGNSYGEVFIAVGYGLEGAIPDAYAKRIIDNVLIPHFRENDYFSGVAAACEVLMDLASGEISEAPGDDEDPIWVLVSIFIVIVLVIFILALCLGDTGHGGSGRGGHGTGSFSGPTITGRSFHGGGSSGGFGSFGGGGFGGFGGGSFGGGGAGGRW